MIDLRRMGSSKTLQVGAGHMAVDPFRLDMQGPTLLSAALFTYSTVLEITLTLELDVTSHQMPF